MLSLWLPYLFYMAFQPFVQAESTAGMFYVTDLAYKGLVTFSNAITISTKRGSSLSEYNGKSSCRKYCTEEPSCLAYQIHIFPTHTNCTLFNENLCTRAVLVNVTNFWDSQDNVIWEKVNGRMSAASCLSMQRAQMQSAGNAPGDPPLTFNDSLPTNIVPTSAPKLCSDYYQLGFRYDGDLVPVWPWGYGNGTVKVRCYGMYTAFFTNSYYNVLFEVKSWFWVLNTMGMSQPNQTQVDAYYRSINFSLLADMVNLPVPPTSGGMSTSRKLVFKLTCLDCWGFVCPYKSFEATYSNFNITSNGTLMLGAYEGGVSNGLGSPMAYPFRATGDCGPFWRIENDNSCNQKSYLLFSQRFDHPLRWDGKICTEAAILFL